MLRNVLLMATSGLVLFSKEFVNAVSQPRLIGSLLTAMMEFSTKTSGMPVSYIELSNVAVTVVTHDVAKVFCAMFHDREDGPAFGRLIATEILMAFVETYSGDLTSAGRNLKDFHAFHHNISDVIRNSVRPVLLQLQQQRGVSEVLLVTDDVVTFSSGETDELGVLANLQALLALATDIMSFSDDAPVCISLGSSRTHRLLLLRVTAGGGGGSGGGGGGGGQPASSTLLVRARTNASPTRIRAAITDAADMLGKVCMLMANLQTK